MTSHTEPIAAEKPPEVFAETVSFDNHDPRLVALTPEHRKRVMRRVNLRVVVMLAVIYIISISDRNNLGLAAVAGMTEDLDLKGTRYSVAVLVSSTVLVPGSGLGLTWYLRCSSRPTFCSSLWQRWQFVKLAPECS